MEKSKSKPTIEDVAKYCGVSVSTVSRVINKSSPVSRELHTKVEKAVDDLGFQPRQRISRSRPEKIGLLVPNVLNPSFVEIINGAQEEAERQGLNLAIFHASENPERQMYHLNLLKKWGLDGLTVMRTQIPAEMLVKFQVQNNMPIVVSRLVEIPQLACIMVDYATAIVQTTRYLLSLNHRRIACISGPPEWESSIVILKNVRQTLKEANLRLHDDLYRCCFPNIEESSQIVHNFLSLPENIRPTAIMAFNDLSAIGAIHAIHSRGLQVPGDISVVGFGDISMAAYTNPPLTTIAQPTYQIGQLAVKTLADLMNKRIAVSGGFTLLKCSLVVRETTGPCPENYRNGI